MSPYSDNVEMFLNIFNKFDNLKKEEILRSLLNDMYKIYGTPIEKKLANALLQDKYIR